MRRWLDAFGQERILVCLYADLETDPQLYLDRVTTFIDIPSISISNSHLRTRHALAMKYRPLRPRLAFAMSRVQRILERDPRFRKRMVALTEFCFKAGAPFPPLDPDFAAHLRKRFRGDNEAVEKIIGRDLSAWK